MKMDKLLITTCAPSGYFQPQVIRLKSDNPINYAITDKQQLISGRWLLLFSSIVIIFDCYVLLGGD